MLTSGQSFFMPVSRPVSRFDGVLVAFEATGLCGQGTTSSMPAAAYVMIAAVRTTSRPQPSPAHKQVNAEQMPSRFGFGRSLMESSIPISH